MIELERLELILANCPHLSAQFVFGSLEFLERPPGKLDDHVITPGRVFFQRAFPP